MEIGAFYTPIEVWGWLDGKEVRLKVCCPAAAPKDLSESELSTLYKSLSKLRSALSVNDLVELSRSLKQQKR